MFACFADSSKNHETFYEHRTTKRMKKTGFKRNQNGIKSKRDFFLIGMGFISAFVERT